MCGQVVAPDQSELVFRLWDIGYKVVTPLDNIRNEIFETVEIFEFRLALPAFQAEWASNSLA
jgi:hypothetical protein